IPVACNGHNDGDRQNKDDQRCSILLPGRFEKWRHALNHLRRGCCCWNGCRCRRCRHLSSVAPQRRVVSALLLQIGTRSHDAKLQALSWPFSRVSFSLVVDIFVLRNSRSPLASDKLSSWQKRNAAWRDFHQPAKLGFMHAPISWSASRTWNADCTNS